MTVGRVPGPLGLTSTSGTLALTSGVGAVAVAARTREQFKAAVLSEQISRRERRGRVRFAVVPSGELAVVEGGHRLRTLAAASCRALLAAARTALEQEKAAGNALAQQTAAIGIASAYRDFARDQRAWNSAFDTQYDRDQNREHMQALPGGRNGDEALDWFTNLMDGVKAPPGFSNHSNGVAVDFSTTHAGAALGPNTRQRAAWRGSWLHPWLVANAAAHRYHPLATEEWHWDWR